MAAPGVHDMVADEKHTPVQSDNLTREEPLPVKPTDRKKDSPSSKCHKLEVNDIEMIEETVNKTEVIGVTGVNNTVTLVEESVLPDSATSSDLPENGAGLNGDEAGSTPQALVVLDSPQADSERSDNLCINETPTELNLTRFQSEIANALPLIPEILDSPPKILNTSLPCDNTALNLSNVSKTNDTQLDIPPTELQPKPPYKGVVVPCGQLKDYLDSLPTFNRKCMLRKGREVHKIYVDMTKGESFLDDQFAYTEFGKMVLTNGSIRAGRAKNAKQIVVARETLYCSGTAACKRACGGYGVCIAGCDKTKMRGHRCSYRIKLTQRLGFVNFWFVEELGSHDQLIGKDCDFKVNSQLPGNFPTSTTPSHKSAIDLTNGEKFSKNTNSSRSLKKDTTPSPDRSSSHSMTGSPLNRGNPPVSDTYNVNSGDISTNYHYVLGLMPSGSPSRESPSRASPASSESHLENLSSQSPSQQRALEMYREIASQIAMATANASGSSSQVTSSLVTSTLPVGVNYMPDISSLNMEALQTSLNPLLVNVKQEPGDELHSQLMYPMMLSTAGAQIPFTPTRISKSHSPSPSRAHSLRESPLVQRPSPTSSIQKGIEIENKIKNEIPQRMQAQQETLGQVHNRIMERAKARKSAQTVRVMQKNSQEQNMAEKDYNSIKPSQLSNADPNISVVSSVANTVSGDNSIISSLAFNRFQTLNRILQSEAFQVAKSQLESNKRTKSETDPHLQETALNLTVKQSKDETQSIETPGNQTNNYFKLIEEWKKGGQLQGLEQSCDSLPNGHVGAEENIPVSETWELTQNEKELMCRVRQLESHVKQLQNIVIKRDGPGADQPSTNRRKKAQREFDFTKYNTRHVALKILYIGCDYQGFAVQEETDRTIEQVLFEALRKTRLIEARETSSYHRCGRTDKGVSAFGQVISIDLRTNLTSGVGVKVREGGTAHERQGDKNTEIRYCHILNKVLPPEIRVLAWAPVDPDFSARFSCKKRTYKYIFPRGSLDVKVMDTAVQKLIGEHDFRNLCKMDVANGVTNFTRKILSADVVTLDDSETGYTMCELTIVGSSFLWHQIRCIVTVIFLIGQGKENPEILDELLNIEKTPRKPQYTMASEIPLCLYDTEFGEDFEWIYEADWHEDNIRNLQQLWAQHSVKATMLKRMLEDMDKAKVETECDIAPWSDLSPPVLTQGDWLLPGHKHRVYKPLFERPTCDSLEDRMEHFAKKRKLNTGMEEPTKLPASE